MTMPAATPKPPYYAVIFTSIRRAGDDGYADMAQRMVELASQQPGFLGFETVRQQIGISVSYWDSLDAIKGWKQNAVHRLAQGTRLVCGVPRAHLPWRARIRVLARGGRAWSR